MINDDVQKYKELEEQFQKEYQTRDGNYYLISLQWLNKWKKKYGYDSDPNNSINLDILNSDITTKQKCILKLDPFESHPWNIQLKQNLIEGQDYVVVDYQMLQLLKIKQKQNENTLERESYLNQDNVRVIQAYLQCVKFVPVFPQAMNKLKNGMIEGEQYISPLATIKEIYTIFGRTLKTVTSAKFQSQDNVRFYKLDLSWNLDSLKQTLINQWKDKKSQCFQLENIEYLDPNDNKQFKDYNFQKEQILLMDAKESGSPFLIANNLFPLEEKCTNCQQYSVLSVNCICQKVKYCSESCLNQHSYTHQQVCEKLDDTNEILLTLIPSNQSKLGLTGLRNLGNTCYMNSAIQCLSNIPEIANYFLDNSFSFDINLQNTLGTKGEFASVFAYLIKRLWFDKQSQYSPMQFKRLVGKLNPVFAGNAQHDAQEFITFALDLLNEDLNRVKLKPYVEIPDNNNRPDSIVSAEQWECFKKRNDSHIVDNLYGQYRSKLQCPICHKISITFDPYLMVNVTIPQETKKTLEFTLIDPENYWLIKTVTHYYEPDLRIKEILQFKSQEWLQCDWDQIILTLSSVFSIEEVFLDQRLELLKKQLKMDKKLQLRRLTTQEQIISDDQQVHVLVHNQILNMNNWKKDIIPSLYFIISQKYTYKQIHLFLFQCYKTVLQQFSDFDQKWLESENLEEIYEKNILDTFWKLQFKTNQRYMVNCSYCYKNYCTDCPIDFIDKLFEDCFSREDKLLQPEIQIIWLKPLKEKIEDVYHDYQKIFDPNYKPPAVNLGWDNQKKMNKYKQSYTLEYCLEYSTKPEQLQSDNTWYCNGCKDHVQAYKTLQIYKTPKILIFHLKRFKDSYKLFKSKLQTNIEFPEKLDMKNFVLYEENNNQYELYAICNHIGESGSGHYTAYCKNNGDWCKFDDSYVTKESGSVITQNAYVLFYRRIDNNEQNYNLEQRLQENIEKLKIQTKNQEIQSLSSQQNQIINDVKSEGESTLDQQKQTIPIDLNKVQTLIETTQQKYE